MVWKSDFFSGFMRFVRVPPYENWAFWTNFYFSWENGEFFGVKHVAPSSTLKMRKSHKKSARVYAYTHAYTQLRDGGGRSAPPRSYRVKSPVFQLQNVDKKNIYFYKHDIYFNKLMFIFKNINLELKLALRTKYWFLQTLLYLPFFLQIDNF